MYRPWKPLDLALSFDPLIEWRCTSRTLHIIAEFWTNGGPAFVLEIEFEEGLAGFHAFDESTYASTESVPRPERFDRGDCEPTPWPFWKSQQPNERIQRYGDLGRINYAQLDTYCLFGADTVLLFDIADCEPKIVSTRQGGAN